MIEIAIRELSKKLEIAQKEKDGIQLNVEKFEHAYKCLNKLIDFLIVDNCKKGLGYENYNAVPPPYTGNFMPSTPDLSFTGLDEFVNKPVVENCKAKSSEKEPKLVRKNDDALIIKKGVSNNKEENVPQFKYEKKTVRPGIAKIEFVKSKQQGKTARKTVKQVEQHRKNTHSPRVIQRNWNNMMSQKLGINFEMFNKACYVCGSFEHLQVDCNYHQKQFQNQRMIKPVWNNAQRVNHQNFAIKTHPCAKKNMVPRAVLMKSGLASINNARQVNAAHSKTTANIARPMTYLSKTAHLTVKRPIHKNTTFRNNNVNQRVNTVRGKNSNTTRPKAVVNVVKGNNSNVVKASACWVWKPKHKVLDYVSKHNSTSITVKKFDYGNSQIDLKDQRVIDSGCSRHMTGNISYLTDYKEIDEGYVAFEGNLKGKKITGKRITKTEVVHTACYVQNKVLVVKPHNKTLYELFHGKTPTLSFMRPFGCPVTILHTIDHLGKFDGKADEGFFVGYSLNSKAFRVFNSRTRIVEENLHIRPKSSNDDGFKPSSDDGKKVDEDPRKENECNDQKKENNVNITNNVNTVSSIVNTTGINRVNVVDENISIELPFDPNMPALEDVSTFDFSSNDEHNVDVANMNNLDTTIQVSPIPTTRIHKDHPLDQVIRDWQSATQTRRMLKNSEEHGIVSTIQ
nr:ribonuclease H-like domain-containing protein [Tanacetum cinerariifolium]